MNRSASGLQLLVGPNGGLVWTEAAQVDRSQSYAGEGFAIPEKSAARVHGQSAAAIRPRSPRKPLYTRLVSPTSWLLSANRRWEFHMNRGARRPV
jgi:S1-C subfamily serine protease